ncbi:ring canal kelch-like protein isoform X2 [Senna tora]|uniref:Ring canal kelch-like protein isoform X2 n=1 Tax=Senna tora TaxID=362788 RepID=A0A835CJ82_9FABA|nr:ring canal kelch-like protein isoform X2 [Senna tora]
MGAGRKTQTFYASGSQPIPPNAVVSSLCGRNLAKHQLGGVIFGCKNTTIKECLSKQLFGLPAQHFSYVKNIDPGLPLFLFNYSDRKLHGIFEAASSGQMFIDPYGWTADGSERTLYPAQVQIRVRLQCQPLSEDKFRQVILDNYYFNNHFWFELDHGQTSKLMSLLASSAIGPGNYIPQKTMQWRTVSRSLPSHETSLEGVAFGNQNSEMENSTQLSQKSDSSGIASSFDANADIWQWDSHNVVKDAEQDEKSLIFMKLKELALNRESQDPSLSGMSEDTPDVNDMNFAEKGYLEASTGLEKKEECPSPPFEYQYIITQLMQEVKELTAFKATQTQKYCYLEQKLVEAELEIQHLKDRCTTLESAYNLSLEHDEKTVIQSSNELHLDLKESLFLIGGYDGESFLATMDLYCPSLNVLKSLKPMSSVRSYASVVQSNGELYVFGGGDGSECWYDTVESYNPISDKWTLWPSLNQKKGSLAGAALSNKIFAIGGGNGIDCYSDVEMLDLDLERWICARSMLDKRFALAAVEFNGVIYATGGFDGNDYLQSAERFDPREHSWTKIANMNTNRGCHSLVVLNEKLYALGGFDGEAMVSSVEVFDPRLGTWMMGEPMNHSRGYSAAAVVKDSIYVIGGVKVNENILDTVENYKEGQGWQETCATRVGKRCFLSAISL